MLACRIAEDVKITPHAKAVTMAFFSKAEVVRHVKRTASDAQTALFAVNVKKNFTKETQAELITYATVAQVPMFFSREVNSYFSNFSNLINF